MKVSKKKSVIGAALLVLLMILSVSSEVLGQGRGRRVSQLDKKCGKFVNCHDARDGRLDGRGPNRRFRRNRRNRDRDRDFDRITRRRRNRDRDRDSDRDPFWRGRRY